MEITTKGKVILSDQLYKTNELNKKRSVRSLRREYSEINRGFIYIYIRESLSEYSQYSFQPIRFPYVHYEHNYPFQRSNNYWKKYLSNPVTYADQRNQQTIIYAKSGVFIIPSIVNKHKKLFSIAQLISDGYATFRRKSVLPERNFIIEKYIYPDEYIDRKMPKFNYQTGRFQNGIDTEFFSSFISYDSNEYNSNYKYDSSYKIKNKYYKKPPMKVTPVDTTCYEFQKWSLVANMNYQRTEHTASLLHDGKVLVTGGYNPIYGPLNTAEIYNPLKNQWKNVTNMHYTRYAHTATVLKHGQVLVTGGYSLNVGVLNTVELYDPNEDTWTLVANLTVGRTDHKAILLHDGNVLIVGGYNNTDDIHVTELYDPYKNIWTRVADMSVERHRHAVTLLKDGCVLAIGGHKDLGYTYLKSVELYNSKKNKWKNVANMSTTRQYHTATLLHDGCVLVTGGYNESNNRLNTTELFHPETNQWKFSGEMNYVRAYHSAIRLKNNQILVIGGVDNLGYSNVTEIYNPANNSWIIKTGMNYARSLFTVTLLQNGAVLAVGGFSSDGPMNSSELSCVK